MIFDTILDYIIQYAPVIVALLSEVGIVKLALKYIDKIKDTNEYKQLLNENRLLRKQIKAQNEKMDELMTLIDKVARTPKED